MRLEDQYINLSKGTPWAPLDQLFQFSHLMTFDVKKWLLQKVSKTMIFCLWETLSAKDDNSCTLWEHSCSWQQSSEGWKSKHFTIFPWFFLNFMSQKDVFTCESHKTNGPNQTLKSIIMKTCYRLRLVLAALTLFRQQKFPTENPWNTNLVREYHLLFLLLLVPWGKPNDNCVPTSCLILHFSLSCRPQ